MSTENDSQLSNRLNAMYSQIGEVVLRHAMVKLLGTEIAGMASKHEIEQAVKQSIARGLAAWCDANIVPTLHAKLDEQKAAILDGTTMALEQVTQHLRQAAQDQVAEIIKDPKFSKGALNVLFGVSKY